MDKKQLYRAKDFSTAISGVEMTKLYKEAMSFSKKLKGAGWLAVGAGLYGNAKDVFEACDLKDTFDEQCGRSVTKNVVSSGVNVAVGVAIGWAIGLAPVTGGLSVVLVGGGALVWGLVGSDVSNAAGEFIEEQVFD